MTVNRISGADREASLRRTAIVLSTLPASVAAGLMSSFDDSMKKSLRRTMTTLTDVDPLERHRALQAFKGSLQQQQQQKLPQQPAHAERERQQGSSPPMAYSSLSFLGDVEDDVLLDSLKHEHPQAIALVLASISPAQAARLLPQLDSVVQQDALARIGRLGEVPENTLADLASHLRERVEERMLKRSSGESMSASGQRALNAILAAMPSKKQPVAPVESQPLPSARSTVSFATDEFVHSAMQESDRISKESPAIRIAPGTSVPSTKPIEVALEKPTRQVAKIRSASVNDSVLSSTDRIHEHLTSLTPKLLCEALAKVSMREALLTLCGLPNFVAEATLRELPRAYAKQVRDQMSTLGSLELREIDDAKAAVAAVSFQNREAVMAA